MANTNKNEKIEEVCNLSPEFCRKIYKCKKTLYNDIIFSSKNIESNEAHNNSLLQQYINALNYLYNTTMDVITNNTNNTINTNTMPDIGKEYSDNSMRTLKDTTRYMNSFFKNNKTYNKLLYTDYLTNKLIVFPFIHRRDFPV